MAKTISCPNCSAKGQIAPTDGTFPVLLGHRWKRSPILRCSSCNRGMIVSPLRGLLFGKPALIREGTWNQILLCADGGLEPPMNVPQEPIGAAPGFACMWE